jgi:hypothetical protein
MHEERMNNEVSINIPVWRRTLLTIVEAAQFYHIGEKRLRMIVDMHPEGDFYLMNGNRVLIKRELFEKFIAESSVI